MLIAALQHAEFVAWVCLGLGVVLVVLGTALGLILSLRRGPGAKQKIDEAKQRVAEASDKLQSVSSGAEAAAATDAKASTDAAESALEQVEGIVGALPENLRFSGMLVLVGVVLISVATVQFGGVSLF
jgi:hypothetical protein